MGSPPQACWKCESQNIEVDRQEVILFLRRRVANTDSAEDLVDELAEIPRIVEALAQDGWEVFEPIVTHAHFVKYE